MGAVDTHWAFLTASVREAQHDSENRENILKRQHTQFASCGYLQAPGQKSAVRENTVITAPPQGRVRSWRGQQGEGGTRTAKNLDPAKFQTPSLLSKEGYVHSFFLQDSSSIAP